MLKFRIYHVWLWGIILTSLLRTWLISGAKSLLSTTTITLPPKNPVPGNITLPQLEEYNSCRYEGIIFPRQSNNLHNTNADFNCYTREKVMKMTKLELFLILFPVDYLKEILFPESNKLLKHPMELGEFIRCLGCWFYMGCWVGIPNRRNW